jgi:hypothetical protein
MPKSTRRAATIALAVVALGMSACGGSDDEVEIPAQNADVLLQTLSDVRAAVEAGECTSATTDATQFVEAVNSLPKEVGEQTKNQLREAGENLRAMTQDPAECQEPEEEEPVEPEIGASGVEGEQG